MKRALTWFSALIILLFCFTLPVAAQDFTRPSLSIIGTDRIGPYTYGRLRTWLNHRYRVVEDNSIAEYQCQIYDAGTWRVGGGGGSSFPIIWNGRRTNIRLDGDRTVYRMTMLMEIIHLPSGQTVFSTASGPTGRANGYWNTANRAGDISVNWSGSGDSSLVAIADFFRQLPQPGRVSPALYYYVDTNNTVHLFGPPQMRLQIESYNLDNTLRRKITAHLDQSGRSSLYASEVPVNVKVIEPISCQVIWQGIIEP